LNTNSNFKGGTKNGGRSLYGIAWSQLSKHDYFEAAGLLSQRLINSNISADFLNGAYCLDMATGIARWALAMVQLGASKVIGVDFSKDCLKEAHCRLKGLDEEKKIELKHADLYKLPASFDSQFDFVCANGVIHHLPDPKGALETMERCTKKGGNAFLFVFSKNEAPWWSAIELMREIVNPAPISYAQSVLESFEAPGSQRFNMLDYSYTPIQHKFEKEWVEETLREAGFSEVNHLEGGVIHDSVLRCKLFDNDKLIYGVSEIRYLLKK
jgi:ubiquinone/menaquinone biosynthesis C-methylase UbiE